MSRMLVLLLAVGLRSSTSTAVVSDSAPSQANENTGTDSSCLLQQPQHSLELERKGHSTCEEVLPFLTGGEELLQICQKGLTSTACSDALDALGPQPWSEEKVADVCKEWTEGVGTEIATVQLSSLLSRSKSEDTRMEHTALDSALAMKDDYEAQRRVGKGKGKTDANQSAGSSGNATNTTNATKGAAPNATTPAAAAKSAAAAKPAAATPAAAAGKAAAPTKAAAAAAAAPKAAAAAAPKAAAAAAPKAAAAAAPKEAAAAKVAAAAAAAATPAAAAAGR